MNKFDLQEMRIHMTKLILVDDEKMILNSLSRYVKTQLPDFELCGCFYDGSEALEYLLKNPVYIVVTDICMPQVDGLELAREISLHLPQCVVIILSGYSEFEYAQNAIKYNVFNYMLKPLDYRELKNVLEKARGTAAVRRSIPSCSDLSDEETELFFVDLFFGSIFSVKELKERFSSLHLPFPLEESAGYLVRLTLNETAIRTDAHYE
ncbi:MAG: response regulator, partial [Clostridia bacterium]|nr:response regulator [Clostridia bacterium]